MIFIAWVSSFVPGRLFLNDPPLNLLSKLFVCLTLKSASSRALRNDLLSSFSVSSSIPSSPSEVPLNPEYASSSRPAPCTWVPIGWFEHCPRQMDSNARCHGEMATGMWQTQAHSQSVLSAFSLDGGSIAKMTGFFDLSGSVKYLPMASSQVCYWPQRRPDTLRIITSK